MICSRLPLLPILTVCCAAAFCSLQSIARAAPVVKLTLDQAYDRALNTDQNIQTALQAVRQADLLPAQALTRLTPRLNASLGASRSGRDGRNTDWTHSNAGRGRVSISQPLVDFTVGPAVRAGKLSAAERRLDFREVVRETLLAVASAYYNVLQQQQLVAVNRESLRLAEEQKELSQALVEVEEGLRTDVLRADVAVQRAKRALTESENSLSLARTILANTLNEDPGAVFEVQEPPSYQTFSQPVEVLRMQARARREDVHRAFLAVQRRRENLRETRANYYPSLSADAGIGRDFSNSSASSGTDRSDDYSAGLSVSIPLFSGGQRRLDIRNAESEIAQAELEYQRLVKAADEEVTGAWLRVQTLQQILAGLRAEVASAEENYRLLREQYRVGEVNSLDVAQALTDLTISRTDLTVSTYQYQLALRELAARVAALEPERVEQAVARLGAPPPVSPLSVPPAPETLPPAP